MSLLQAILMGLIQGLTEFLPVSSSGHLAIFKQILGVNTDTGIMFDVLLHLGTLLAIFVAYYKDIWKLICEGFALIRDLCINFGRFIGNLFTSEKKEYLRIIHNSYRKFVVLIIVSTIPTGVIGVLASDLIEQASEILLIPGICLLITAALLFAADRLPQGEKKPQGTSYGNALFVGICQGFATLPGLSRSGTTITACLFCGFERKFAVKYSFIMSIPAVLGAAVLELKDLDIGTLATSELLCYGAGMVVAAVVGYICIKTMLVVVRKKKFTIFSIYCLALGLLSILGYFFLV